ncbi:MAG: hypothetical protein ACYDH9_12210 [Limisphaerales bacterium]
MAKSPVMTVLIVLLMLNAAATAAFSCAYVLSMRELQRVRGEMEFVNRNRTLFQALANEAIEYSKRNPAIDPILQSVGINPKAAASPTAARPGGR